jgi:cell division protein FtsI/penicillin-binding protein 2
MRKVINDKICSDGTLKKMQEMLEAVVSEGTGKKSCLQSAIQNCRQNRYGAGS